MMKELPTEEQQEQRAKDEAMLAEAEECLNVIDAQIKQAMRDTDRIRGVIRTAKMRLYRANLERLMIDIAFRHAAALDSFRFSFPEFLKA